MSRRRVHFEGKNFHPGAEDKVEVRAKSRGQDRLEIWRPNSGLHTSLSIWMEHAEMLTYEADDLAVGRSVGF